MDKHLWHEKVWRVLYILIHKYFAYKFNMSYEVCYVEGPCIIIPNHVTDLDPLLVAQSFPKKQMYFVASEHLFRKGIISKLLSWLVAPIPRKKASSGADTVIASLRHIRAGHSVCIFAEGEASWNGRSKKIFTSTGRMIKASGATLITYRLEGGYLSNPRWSKVMRRGKMHGYAVNIYPPEKLKAMTVQEINDAIDTDIYEDAWERQREEQVSFKGKNRAEQIETALFMCPKCGKIGTIKGHGNTLLCECGLSLEYTEFGTFEPPQPFENIAQWDDWQHEQLKNDNFEHSEILFFDEDLMLTKIEPGHKEQKIAEGRLCQYHDAIVCAGCHFELSSIGNMAMVQANVLLFSIDKSYYEIRTTKPCCLRKYLAMWNNAHAAI